MLPKCHLKLFAETSVFLHKIAFDVYLLLQLVSLAMWTYSQAIRV